ncbi:MAG TPA: nitrate- and nitrite sensing domain-containing protein [Amycolatopsis sp.]|uniref:sensor histidine kinase n=1 Tax=Amycolatopsis sp. TaxID=37632 RepID=UPI002B471DD4|nr:nitrate- and nitrite sensing domain-containing protein [Amycolatopsis sp.]HKS44851.1 nitrate- and nitrite sensing domain-containing protein [Amycolatopsis sp.]
MTKKTNPGEGHHKSIRKRLTGTVLIPSIALLVMWIGVSGYFVINGVYVRTVGSSVQQVSIPAVTALGSIQQERQLSLIYLERPSVGLRDLQLQQQSIDRPLGELRSAIQPVLKLVPDEIAAKMTQLGNSLDQLPVIRAEINLRTISKAQVNDFYNHLIDTAAGLFDAQARLVPDVAATQGAIGATDIFRSADQMSRAASIVSSAFAAGSLTPADHLQFAQLVGSYRATLVKLAPFMEPDVAAHYQSVVNGDAWKRLSTAEDALVSHGSGTFRGQADIGVSETDWRALSGQVSTALNQLTIEQADRISALAVSDGNDNLRNAILGSVLALIAAIASIIVAVRVSRTLVDRALVTRLERLRNDSIELAQTRLPSIVRRLKDGESVDVTAELPRLDHGKDEIGQVAEAFNIAQLTAVNAAVSEAKARNGVHNVFLGIAHRNQGLVHRQIQILDRMESREENPTQLKGLFQLDHLATRARRTTENLIILGGRQPGRRWRKPVWLMDVLRAAISETEHYARVEVETVPQVAIVGSAVADTIHLVAELVDNATSFSPPGSPVHMTSTMVARGVVVDVADQGLGMKDDVREWANRMMSEPPEFDAMALKADTSLGLFVVSRLAARLGVQVMFDSSRYGGTRATILIPTAILASDDSVPDNAEPEFGELSRGLADDPANGADGRGESASAIDGSGVVGAGQCETSPAKPITTGIVMSREPEISRDAEPSRADPTVQTFPVAPPRPGEPGTKRPKRALPQREPQQHIVARLRDDPDADLRPEDFAGRTRSTLSAFHKGTRRGRDMNGPEDITSHH